MKKLLMLFSLLFVLISCDDPVAGKEIKIAINPNPIYFSTVYIGSSSTQTVAIKNIGNGDLKIEDLSVITSPDDNAFSIIDKPEVPLTIKSKKELIITIKFEPTQVATYEGRLRVDSNASNGKRQNIQILTSENLPIISVNPQSIRFDNANPGQTYLKEVSIKNIGAADLIIPAGSLKLSAGTPVVFSLSNIPEGEIKICPLDSTNETCLKEVIVNVNFTPTDDSSVSGFVEIASNDTNNSPLKIPIYANIVSCSVTVFPIEPTIDFGSRRLNTTYQREIRIKNSGNEICTIDTISIVDDDSGVFVLDSIPTLPKTLAGREAVSFFINFTPVAISSYSANLQFTGSDPLWTNRTLKVPLIGEGRDVTGPVAVCNPEYFEVEPAIDNPNIPGNSLISLNGSSSYDTNGGQLTYFWRKLSGPVGTTAAPRTPTQAISQYFVDVSGEHLLELTVTNEDGLTDSCQVTAYGLSSNALHIELFWEVASDVDLHLRKPAKSDDAWFTADDCYFGNCVTGGGATIPCTSNEQCLMVGGTCVNGSCDSGGGGSDGLEWGQPGREDNPRLDRDDMSQRGPENINLAAPFDSEGDFYTVAVHYYSDGSDAEGGTASGGTNASVRVYCNGDMQYNGTQFLEATNWWWYAANVSWVGDGTDGTCEVRPINVVLDHKP